LARTVFGYLDFGRNSSAQKGHLRRGREQEAARKLTGICAKGVLREGEFTALQPREARVIKVGGRGGATENDVDRRN
jgi:hypothetical protein